MRDFTTEQVGLILEFGLWLEENTIGKTQGGQVPDGKKYVLRTSKVIQSGYIGGFSIKELWIIFLSQKEKP